MIDDARKPGRPRIDASPVNVRLPPDQLAGLDRWIAAQPRPRPSRAEAIRRILAATLAAPAPSYSPGQTLILGAVTAAELLNAHPDPKPRLDAAVFGILAERRRGR